jgi:hypothetical protein
MSEGDVWEVQEPRAAGDIAGPPPAPSIVLERPRDTGFLAWVIAGILFLAAGVLQAATLFTDSRQVTGVVGPGYETVAFDVVFGIRTVVMLACGVLLLVSRVREFAGGLAVGFGLELLAGYFWQLRPSTVTSLFVGHGWWLLVGAYSALAMGTVIALVVLLRRRERVREQRTGAERRVDRVAAVSLGFAGAVFWWIAAALTWYRLSVTLSSGGSPLSRECCSWSDDDGWKQVGILAGGATIVVLALFAATARSKLRAVGLLLGAVAAGLQDLAVVIAIQVAPMPTMYGIHYRRVLPADSGSIAGTGTPGFWLALIGLLLLSGAAVTRLALGSRKAAYPQNELERIAS